MLKHDLLAPTFSEPKADFGAARQDLAAGFAGALPGPRLTSSSTRAPHKRALTELGKHTHVPHKRAPTFTPHTKGARASCAPTTVPMGRAFRARPMGTVVFPFVCGALFCVARVCAFLAL